MELFWVMRRVHNTTFEALGAFNTLTEASARLRKAEADEPSVEFLLLQDFSGWRP